VSRADKILKLYKFKELRERMRENAFKFVSENSSKQRMIEKISGIMSIAFVKSYLD